MPTAYLIVLFTQQLELTKAFYEHLGIQFESGQHGKGPKHYSGKLGETVFELYPCESDTQVTQTRLGLMAGPEQQFNEEQKATLNDLADAVHPFDNGQTYLVLNDPDGRQIEFLYS